MQSTSHLGTMIQGFEVYCYDFFLGIPSCSSGFIQDFLDYYVWIYVGSMMYMSGEASFIVWVDWNAGSVSKPVRLIIF